MQVSHVERGAGSVHIWLPRPCACPQALRGRQTGRGGRKEGRKEGREGGREGGRTLFLTILPIFCVAGGHLDWRGKGEGGGGGGGRSISHAVRAHHSFHKLLQHKPVWAGQYNPHPGGYGLPHCRFSPTLSPWPQVQSRWASPVRQAHQSTWRPPHPAPGTKGRCPCRAAPTRRTATGPVRSPCT